MASRNNHKAGNQESVNARFYPFERIVFSEFEDIPWPCFIKPEPNELLTSWLTRLAHNHLVRYYAFCSSNFFEAEFWNRDLDRKLPDSIKGKITAKCRLSESDVQAMGLNSFQPNLFINNLEPRSYWLTQLLFYKTNRKHDQSMSVCPSCLKKDPTPYYRKSWRLTIATVCVSCKRNLIDECPKCGSAINYLLAERGKKFQAPLFPITCCWKCLYDFRKFKSSKASALSLRVQERLDKYLLNGYDEEHGVGYSHLYFSVLKKIISVINKKSLESERLQKLICKQTRLDFKEPMENRRNTFNDLKVNERRELLNKAVWLLDGWPDRFRDITAKAGLRSKIFFNDFADCPYWFYQEVKQHNQVIHSEWRKIFPDFSYGSFKEFSTWQVSKSKSNKSVGKNARRRSD